VDRRGRRQDRLHRARSPWENGYIESFNARFRDELLDGEIFYFLKEAQVDIEEWRRHYNIIRPRSLGYRPPAPETIVPPPMHQQATWTSRRGLIKIKEDIKRLSGA
jgi:transposase InsO family protein